MTYPQYNWENFTLPYMNFAALAKIMVTLKFIVIPNGSNAHHISFMSPFTAVCLVNDNRLVDGANTIAAAAAKLWFVAFQNPNLTYHMKGGGYCKIDLALEAISKLLFALENGKWPEMKKYINLFDPPLIRKLMKYNMENEKYWIHRYK